MVVSGFSRFAFSCSYELSKSNLWISAWIHKADADSIQTNLSFTMSLHGLSLAISFLTV